MPRQPQLPPVDTIVRLRRAHRRNAEHPGECRQGHTLTEIGDMYGVTRNAVYYQLRQAGLEAAETQGYLPWTLAPQHAQEWTAHMLREAAKRQRGLPAGSRGKYLDKWLAELGPRYVIDYDREAGFTKVRRRKSDGEGYVRVPTEPRPGRAPRVAP